MEGVMGYYDGVGGTTFRASAYDLARTTRTPAVLIVNSKGMSLSLLAYIKGFCQYREDSGIKGVILNQMSPMLYPRMKKKIEEELEVKVYGYVPRVEECTIESRHLGLVLPGEVADLREKLNRLAKVLEDTLDLDGLLGWLKPPRFWRQKNRFCRLETGRLRLGSVWQGMRHSALFMKIIWNF